MSLFEVKNITVAFGGVKALNDVSFGVDKGEIFTIIGSLISIQLLDLQT